MKVSRLISALSVAALLPLFAVACSSTGQSAADKGGPSRADYPAWFFQEGGVFKEDSGLVIYAMGTARQGPNLATTRDIARHNARAEIAAILGSHMQTMMTSYTQRAGDYYDPDTFSDSENFEKVSRNLSEAFLAGSYQVDAFFADADNQFCVLMRLDLRQSDVIEKAKKAMRENYASKMRGVQADALAKMDEAFAAQDARIGPVPAEYPQD